MEIKTINIKAEAVTEKKTPIIHGVAYDGGEMQVGWDVPVVVDLLGMEIPAAVPLLADHKIDTGNKIGEITATVMDNQLIIEGKITADNHLAKNIITQNKAGAKWQLSIGAALTEYAPIVDVATVNGRQIEAGTIVATKSILREVSVVAVGASRNTNLDIAAKAKIIEGLDNFNNQTKNQELNIMDEEKKVDEVVEEVKEEVKEVKEETKMVDVQVTLRIERERIREIIDICDGDKEVEEKAIKAGWTADQTAKAVLAKVRANRPSVNIVAKSQANPVKTIEAAMMIRAKIDEATIIKECGEQAIEAGYENRNMSIQDAARTCMTAAGKTVGMGFGNSDIKAAFTTALPGILGNVANKRLQQAFLGYSPVALKLAQVADINDFKPSEIYSISDYGNLAQVATSGDDTAKLAVDKFVEAKGTNKLETYGKIIHITRQQLINDDMGAFLRATDILGLRCAKTIDQLFFAKLLANPALADQLKLFSVAHGNLLDITNYALDVAKVKLAIAEFLKQTGLDGEPVGVMPKYLVVPPELYFLAKEICESTYMIGGSAKTAALNPVAGLLEAVQSPYLSNSTYDGHSATDWYLFGAPNELPALEIGFLKGQTTPTIEGSDAEFDTLGYSWRVYYDLGIGVADYRGVLKAGTIPAESSSGE